MSIEEKILKEQLSQHAFDAMDRKVSGLASKAVKEGWEALTTGQKQVLSPYLSSPCEGYTDPGGHKYECDVVLQEDTLLEAWDNNREYDSLLCENCRYQIDHIAFDKEKYDEQ
ncbi:hypothetical protein KIF75_02475 [Serratia ureilytica]|uniref:hypothetical protein n=1 Tax=Serratia ureilytica TaxID=300181 RepID=UPI001BD1347D|nr:hypothetical protein [Serratia ureilytica]MBS7518552.1 hypothetical protein [Serratia ureilytica]